MLLFLCPYLPIGKQYQNAIEKYLKYFKTLIIQVFSEIVKIFKKPTNQWVEIGRQTLPPFTILHSEH
ncbi:hypothetical protein BA768_00610 [Chryseobacterium sp. CBo1]|nr:hypothetical protein BA768_00610 [Chryseobacterium sp. CBo1]